MKPKQKPEKKKEFDDNNSYNCIECGDSGYVTGYNDACDEWEVYHNQEMSALIDRMEKSTLILRKCRDKYSPNGLEVNSFNGNIQSIKWRNKYYYPKPQQIGEI